MLASLILGFGLAFSLTAYIVYFKAVTHSSITPNRWSWLVWSIATGAEALTYNALNEGELQTIIFGVGAVSTALITIRIWSKSTWVTPSVSETLTVVACVLSLALWLAFQLTWWAHMLVVLAVPVAFYPTWKDAWHAPQNESWVPWTLWSVGDGLAVLLTVMHTNHPLDELPYAIVEFLSHLAVVLIVVLRKRCERGSSS